MIENAFADEISRWGIAGPDYQQPISGQASLVRGKAAGHLFIRGARGDVEATTAGLTEMARAALGHLEGDPRSDCVLYARREDRAAQLFAARRAMSDDLMRQAEEEEWDARRLAEEAGVSVLLAQLRMADWLGLLPFGNHSRRST